MNKKEFITNYDNPRVEVIEMEMEQAVLQGSMTGEDGEQNDPFSF